MVRDTVAMSLCLKNKAQNCHSMHLALTITSLTSGGAQRALTHLANHWAQQNHKITIITLEAPGTSPFYKLDPKITLVQLNQTADEHNQNLPRRFGNILKRLFCLRKTLKELKPDTIISFIDVMNITTLLANTGLKIPVVVCERTDPNHHPLPRLYSYLRHKLYPLANKVVCQTQSAASHFQSPLQPKIKVIPNMVQPAAHIKKAPKSLQKTITVGRLSWEKDHPTLIRSFAQLLKQHPNLSLTIYGEGPDRAKLEHLIQELNLKHKVHLPGTTQNISKALLEADLFIFPSLYEGFPNALCEAMAHGLPVIVSNCSGNVDVVRDGVDGRLFPIGDVEALTTIALEIIEDSKLQKALAREAQEISSRFSTEHIYEQWDAVIQSILQ